MLVVDDEPTRERLPVWLHVQHAECVVAMRGGGPGEHGQKTAPIERLFSRVASGHLDERGQNVLAHRDGIGAGSRRNLARQTRYKGAPDARVVAAPLGAGKRGALLSARERQRLVFELGLLENLQDITDLLVERGDFGKVQPEILPRLRGVNPVVLQDQFAGVEHAWISGHVGCVGQRGADEETEGLVGVAAQEGCQIPRVLGLVLSLSRGAF